MLTFQPPSIKHRPLCKAYFTIYTPAYIHHLFICEHSLFFCTFLLQPFEYTLFFPQVEKNPLDSARLWQPPSCLHFSPRPCPTHITSVSHIHSHVNTTSLPHSPCVKHKSLCRAYLTHPLIYVHFDLPRLLLVSRVNILP
jgi:hypothetical protein